MPCCCTTIEIVWKSIPTNHLFQHPSIRSITFIPSNKIILPPHLAEDQDHLPIREFIVEMKFDSDKKDFEEYIENNMIVKDVFDDIDYITQTCYGTIFKRHKLRGYWILDAPCLDCYADLVENGASEEQLRKSILRCYV